MKFLYTAIFLLALSPCFAQKQNVYYFKNDGTDVNNADSADFYRIVKEPDSASVLYNVLEFYKHGEKKLIGKSTMRDPVYLEGQCTTFYKNGAQYAILNYKNGILLGSTQYFYPNGKVAEIRAYPDTVDYLNEDYLNEDYLIKESYNEKGEPLVVNGNGYYKGYDSGFNDVVEEGEIKNGKKDGQWKGVSLKRKINFIENYKDGEIINGIATYSDGTTSTYVGSRSTVPQFEGGLNAWSLFIGQNTHYPKNEVKRGIQGKVILSFVLDENGRVGDIKVVKSVSPALDAEAVRVLSNSPLWTPGIMFGRAVKVAYGMPISFTIN